MIEAKDWHRLAGEQSEVQESDIVWGVVYRIAEDKEDEVRAYLGEI